MSRKLHPRFKLCRKYEGELTEAVFAVIEKHADDLTYAELMSGISRVMHEQLSQWFKRTIREERHGDADTPGDLA